MKNGECRVLMEILMIAFAEAIQMGSIVLKSLRRVEGSQLVLNCRNVALGNEAMLKSCEEEIWAIP